MPIFYDNAKGHDEVLYAALMEEARYYQAIPLENWIKERKYLEAVTVTISHCDLSKFELHENDLGPIQLIPSPDNRPISGSDTGTQSHLEWSKHLIYLCPRRIESHKGDRTRCGRKCDNARGSTDEFLEIPLLRLVTARTKVTIDREKCIAW